MPSFLAGQKLTATLLNQIGTYNTFWANVPMFRMYQSVAQSIPNSAITQVTMDTLSYDSDTGRTGSTPYSYVIPTGMTGRWTFTVHIPMAAGANSEHDVFLLRNGTAVVGSQVTDMVSTLTSELVTLTVPVNAGDVMGAAVYQQTGGAESTFVGANMQPTFEGRLVSLASP
jgi:hypothetical protein